MTDDIEAFVDRYLEMWNETERDRRRKTIEELWAPDAANYTSSIEAVGHDALEARVTASYEKYVGTGVHRFRLAGPYTAHHDAVKVPWEMVAVADGGVAAAGVEFLLLDGAGRIRSDHQFVG